MQGLEIPGTPNKGIDINYLRLIIYTDIFRGTVKKLNHDYNVPKIYWPHITYNLKKE